MRGLQTTLNTEAGPYAASDSAGLERCGIRTEKEIDGTRHILPRRDLSKYRKTGIGIIVFGIVFTTFMFFWMAGPIGGGLMQKGPGKWMSIGFGLMGLPGLGVGLAIILIGAAILKNTGHSEVLITRDAIWAIECIGPIKLKFKRDLKSVERFVVGAAVRSTGNDGQWQDVGGDDFSALKVINNTGIPLLLAPGYSKAVVRMLADSVSASVAELSRRGGTFSAGEEKNIPVCEETVGGIEQDIPVDKPANSSITCRDLDSGFAIIVPPAGLMKGSKGLFFFSLLWNGFMVLFTSVMLFAKSSQKPPLPVYLFIAGFWAIGISMLVGAINMGKRQTMIAVVVGVFGVKKTGLFGTKEIKIRADEIGAVRMGPSGMTVNDKPIMELQVYGRDEKKKAGVLSECREDELLWMAWLIRSKMGLPMSVVRQNVK